MNLGETLEPSKRNNPGQDQWDTNPSIRQSPPEEESPPFLRGQGKKLETNQHYTEVTQTASATEPRLRTNKTTEQTQTTRHHQHRDQPHQRHAPRADELQGTPQASDPR